MSALRYVIEYILQNLVPREGQHRGFLFHARCKHLRVKLNPRTRLWGFGSLRKLPRKKPGMLPGFLRGTPGGTRTPNLVVRTHLLYPVELPGRTSAGYIIPDGGQLRIMHFMRIGKYIDNRLLPKLIKEICEPKDIALVTYSDNWVIKLTKGDWVSWIYGYHFAINNGAVSEIANDKVATYLVLEQAGVSAVPHYLVRSAAKEKLSEQTIKERVTKPDTPFVFKPLSGSSGRYVYYVSSAVEGLAIVEGSSEAGWTASPHQPIKKEYRVIMLDSEPALLYEKTNPLKKGELKLFNLGMGAIARDVPNNHENYSNLERLASSAAEALSLRFAAVDIVELIDGSCKVLEINSGISFEHYGRQAPENRKTAKQIYKNAVELMLDL